MITQPFNAEGVTAKISELQNLPQADLDAESDTIRADFRIWMETNFALDGEQHDYLIAMDANFIRLLGEDVADCMRFRLPLDIIFPPKKPWSSKFIMPESSLTRTIRQDGKYDVTGSVRIEITYEEG